MRFFLKLPKSMNVYNFNFSLLVILYMWHVKHPKANGSFKN